MGLAQNIAVTIAGSSMVILMLAAIFQFHDVAENLKKEHRQKAVAEVERRKAMHMLHRRNTQLRRASTMRIYQNWQKVKTSACARGSHS